MTLSLKTCGALVFDGAELRVAVLHAPDHLAGLGVERDQHAVGLLQDDLAFGIGQAAVDRVAAHLRDHRRVLLRLVLPEDLLRVEVDREDLVRERRVQVHHAVDHQRRALVAAQHAGGEGPRDLHLADVAGVDLLELAVALVVHVTSLHRPVLGVGDVLLDVGIGQRQGRQREQRHAPNATRRADSDCPEIRIDVSLLK